MRLGAPTGGIDGWVFEQQQGVGTAADPGVGQVARQLPGGEVLDRPQLADVNRARTAIGWKPWSRASSVPRTFCRWPGIVFGRGFE